MKVVQILPELNAGGVERGTLEVGKYLVDQGHESIVISNGGRLVTQLEAEGSRHITLPVHKKRLSSLKQVKVLRRLFEEERPDILHLRSRLPAWLAYLAGICRARAPGGPCRLGAAIPGPMQKSAASARTPARHRTHLLTSAQVLSHLLDPLLPPHRRPCFRLTHLCVWMKGVHRTTA